MAMYSPRKYRKIDRDAIQLRLDYRCLSKRVDVFDLARRLGMMLIPYSALTPEQLEYVKRKSEKLKDGFGVMRVVDGELRCYVFYNDAVSIYRQRFTIAHEIKHFIYLEADPTQEQEDMANHFARYLMAPCCLVMPYVSLSPPDVVADFDISIDAAENALNAAANRIAAGAEKLEDFERRFMEEITLFEKQK
ncbi:MAG: ImmA/IrrE family metallo-endopeptidase [Bacilli bacterium]|nr:ImmA/IrrE family metallo-endopeptidase [Bacilli bacterium]